MRPVKQWEPKQWIQRRVDGMLMLVMNFPARGSATRRQILKSREPFSPLEKRGLSPNARALMEAAQGDTEALAGLTAVIAGNVLAISSELRWQRVDMAASLRVANALLSMVLAEAELNDAQIAGLLGIGRSSYSETWKARTRLLQDRCIKPLLAELT